MLNNIVIITGPRAVYGFCPVPPMNDSAPERNIFRLVENTYVPGLKIFVISACSKTQYENLRSVKDNYINLPLPDKFLQISKFLNNKLIIGISNFLLKTHDPLTWFYLNRVSREIKHINPEIIIINSLPQYIRKIRLMFPEKKIGLFQRGEMGSSRKYLSQLEFVITNSDGITNYIKNLVNDPEVIIKKIPNSIDDNFCLQKKEYSTTPRNIIFTGRIDPVKGVLELLKAVIIVRKTKPDVHLTVIGGNFGKRTLTDYENLLISTAKAEDLDVEFVGQVPNHELAKYYQQADIAVFPSIWLESFGMVALEAMRCGLPVIASRRPGFEELVVPGETGFLIEDPKDVDGLAQAILTLLQNPALIQKFGKSGYTRSHEYTPQTAANSFIKFIDETIE